MTAVTPRGLAFIADSEGVVRAVLRDRLGLGTRLAAGRQFAELLETSSKHKWRRFVASVAREKAAFNWQMDLTESDSEKASSFNFAGAEAEGGLLVVATVSTDEESARMYEELLAVSNDQSTALRDALKRLSLMRRAVATSAPDLWEEQTRINNELVNLQRTLTQRNLELKRLNEQKNQLLGIAAHDLRNPISSVLLYCDVLLESQLDEVTQRSLTRVRSICDFMVRIVDNMLDLTALEAGRLVLELEAVDLATLVDGNVGINRDLAASKQIRIEFVNEAIDLPPVSIDPVRFAQVLNNLISNAVKYSNSGTCVRVSLHRDATSVVVTVRDQGQGIAASELDRIFKPFERTSTRPTAGEKSTGLGLAIVERVIRAHQGEITVQSEPGVGTSFAIRLPFPQIRG